MHCVEGTISASTASSTITARPMLPSEKTGHLPARSDEGGPAAGAQTGCAPDFRFIVNVTKTVAKAFPCSYLPPSPLLQLLQK